MSWIWNDKTIKNRYKEQSIVHKKFVFPLFIISLFITGLLLIWKVKVFEIVLISFCVTLFIYTLVNIFLQTPHVQIPDWYPKWGQTIMYIIHFLVASFIFYLVFVGILQHYYPFFEQFVCCDLVKNFPKF